MMKINMLEKFKQVLVTTKPQMPLVATRNTKLTSVLILEMMLCSVTSASALIPGGNFYNLAKEQILEFKQAAYTDMEATIDAFKKALCEVHL
jgi:hypothetical protein